MSDYVAMAKQFKPDYPPMVRAKARIDELQRSYDARRESLLPGRNRLVQCREDQGGRASGRDGATSGLKRSASTIASVGYAILTA